MSKLTHKQKDHLHQLQCSIMIEGWMDDPERVSRVRAIQHVLGGCFPQAEQIAGINMDRGKNQVFLLVEYPDDHYELYNSINHCASSTGASPSTLRHAFNTGKLIRSGSLEGCIVERIEYGEMRNG